MIEPNTIEEGCAEASSEVSSHDILSSKTIKPLNETVFDKLVIETEQELNEEAYNALRQEHKERVGYPPIVGGRGGERVTFRFPDKPFTIVFGGYHSKIDLNPNRFGNFESCFRLLESLVHDIDPEQTTIKRIDLNVDLA